MFLKANKANHPRDLRNSPSIIGADCAITGDILSQGEVHVDGRVNGDVRCEILVVGTSGNITGEISADLVRVLGNVTGQIKSRAVELAQSARVVGDIQHGTLSVEAGAFVEGRFNHMDTSALKALPTPEAVEKADKADSAAKAEAEAGGVLALEAKAVAVGG
ncbi:polymer-forming cytoskeletal [mine drainage metagenome]|uniref:Polymer-forming cytoskeletal n=1 Tax=mine drainage metagenome TaxID=410659 RepID=A0A1J5SQK5_9ZZZZ